MIRSFLAGLLVAAQIQVGLTDLIISSDTMTIEYTPARIALEDYYQGKGRVVSGGIPALLSNTSIDLGTNAEIPALRNYATKKNLRIIFTVTETYYRIIASRKAGINTLADLKGKRIGTFTGSTAGYFVEKYLATAGLNKTDYRVTAGSMCVAEPCAAGTLPYMLARGNIDAMALWEPTPQLAFQALGSDAIVFQNRSVYREIVNLHSTAEKLADPVKRKEIVEFVRALIKTHEAYNTKAETIWPRVGQFIGVDPKIVEAVWPIHGWRGTLAPDLVDVLKVEEAWGAAADGRRVTPAEEVEKLVDTSILKEALATL
jgi:sulfonate transport system substrate-binding protein